MLQNKIKYWRHHHQMNQKEFAKFLGVDASKISKWEGQKEQPIIKTAFKIARKLGITVDELFDYTPE